MTGTTKRSIKMLSWYGIVLIFVFMLVIPAMAFSMNSMSIVSTGGTGGSYSSVSMGGTSAFGTSQSSVTSVSAAAPQPQPAMIPAQGSVKPEDPVPDQWVLDQKSGVYYDPVSKTTWVFDRYLKKFYSPTSGWFLISLYDTGSGRPALVAQFYYDITKGDIYDIATGTIISPDALSGNPGTQPAQQPASSNPGGWTVTNANPTSTTTKTPATTSTGTQQKQPASSNPGGWTVTNANPASTTTKTPATTGKTTTAASNPQTATPPTQSTDLAPEEDPWQAEYYMKAAMPTCGDLEENTDRLGNDYSSMTLTTPDPCACAQLCQDDESCVAFTYVAPGYQGNADAQCFLKNAAGEPTDNEYCTSGVISRY